MKLKKVFTAALVLSLGLSPISFSTTYSNLAPLALVKNRVERVKVELEAIGIRAKTLHHNVPMEELITIALKRGDAILTNTGAVRVNDAPSNRRGRSANDKYFVAEHSEQMEQIEWNGVNVPQSRHYHEQIKGKVREHLAEQEELFVFDGYIGADERFQQRVRFVGTHPTQALSARHLFIRPNNDELASSIPPDFTIIAAPELKVDRVKNRINSDAVISVDVKSKTVLIAGTPYDGEIKKSVFTLLNYIYMEQMKLESENQEELTVEIAPMHASASYNDEGQLFIFNGLSGTGKSTLSANGLKVLADDELAIYIIRNSQGEIVEQGVFNFEGGVFPKTEGLDPDKEPELYNGIRDGAVVLNVPWMRDQDGNVLDEDGKIAIKRKSDGSLDIKRDEDGMAISLSGKPPILNYKSQYLNPAEAGLSKPTKNGRVTVPLDNLDKSDQTGVAKQAPEAIFFLTMDAFGPKGDDDAFGTLPAISVIKDPDMIKYLFLSGYTAKAPGTEVGGAQNYTATFSALFGDPFFPRRIKEYADRLMEMIEAGETKVYLLNTGLRPKLEEGKIVRDRMDLKRITIPLRNAAMNGAIKDEDLVEHPIFKGLLVPTSVSWGEYEFDGTILDPKQTWPEEIRSKYEAAAKALVEEFEKNARKMGFTDLIPEKGDGYSLAEIASSGDSLAATSI